MVDETNRLNSLVTKINLDMALVKQDLKYIRKSIEGNGHKGLIDRVDELESFRWKIIGGIVTLNILLVVLIKFI